MPTRTKFTASNRSLIIEAIRRGHSRRSAAQLARIHPSQISRWLTEGQTSSQGSRKREFYEAVLEAEAECNGDAIQIVRREMRDNAKWATWWLERRDPSFAPPIARQAQRGGGQVVIELSLSDGRPLHALPTSTVEVVEQDSTADSA